jgi:hypothetical protein
MSVYDFPQYSDVSAGLIDETCRMLDASMRRIRHCVEQLSDEEVWWRPSESMNAIGNIVLHLCGNIGQWLVEGVGDEPYQRNRQGEFDHREPLPRAELLARLQGMVERSKAAIRGLDADGLLQHRHIQQWDTCKLVAVLHAVSHFEGHAQEVIYITRLRLGERYRFLWSPG